MDNALLNTRLPLDPADVQFIGPWCYVTPIPMDRKSPSVISVIAFSLVSPGNNMIKRPWIFCRLQFHLLLLMLVP